MHDSWGSVIIQHALAKDLQELYQGALKLVRGMNKALEDVGEKTAGLKKRASNRRSLATSLRGGGDQGEELGCKRCRPGRDCWHPDHGSKGAGGGKWDGLVSGTD